jgi:hypothetical protein
MAPQERRPTGRSPFWGLEAALSCYAGTLALWQALKTAQRALVANLGPILSPNLKPAFAWWGDAPAEPSPRPLTIPSWG